MLLFHATYRIHLESILTSGLGAYAPKPPASYEKSKEGVVHLATSCDVAISYAESSDAVPEAWLDDIVVLEIDSDLLDAKKLFIDSNVKIGDEDDVPKTMKYHGIISPLSLGLHKAERKISP